MCGTSILYEILKWRITLNAWSASRRDSAQPNGALETNEVGQTSSQLDQGEARNQGTGP